ncbi:MAG: O-antigen ligase family protein [Rhodothermales bacterium]
MPFRFPIVRSDTRDQAASGTSIQPVPFLLLLILGALLSFTTLVQAFLVIPDPNLFIRGFELLFVGLFLLGAARSYTSITIHPSVAGWLFLAWLGAATISVALAEHQGHALIRQAEWLTHILFAVCLWSFIRRHPLALKVILVAIPLGFFLVGLNLLFTWMSLSAPRDYHWFTSVPLVGHVRHFGYYGLAALLFSASPLLGSGEKGSLSARCLALAALSVCWGFLFWSGGRAAIGSGFVGLALLTWFTGKNQRLWTATISIAAAGLGLGLSAFFRVNDPRLGFLSSLARTASDTSSYGVNGLTTGRLGIWEAALKSLDGHLWFGLGPDNYRFIPEPLHDGIQPHSLVVQFLTEWGIVGTIPFLILLSIVFWKAYVHLRREQDTLRNTARITALVLMVSFTLHGLVDGLYYYAFPLLVLFCCFAVALLPTTSSPVEASSHPFLAHLTSRRVLWTALVLLSLVFVLNSDFFYLLFFQSSG